MRKIFVATAKNNKSENLTRILRPFHVDAHKKNWKKTFLYQYLKICNFSFFSKINSNLSKCKKMIFGAGRSISWYELCILKLFFKVGNKIAKIVEEKQLFDPSQKTKPWDQKVPLYMIYEDFYQLKLICTH